MSTKICKVKNISNGVFVLALDEVEKGKRFKMRLIQRLLLQKMN